MARANFFRVLAMTAAIGLAASLLVLVAAGPAWAAFPGQNGKIVFESDDWWDGVREISVMNRDGSGRTNLTTNNWTDNPADDFAPAFSPEGSQIAFTHDPWDGDADIYLMDADGSNQTRLTNSPTKDSEPAFSSDGTKIAFVSDRDGNAEIYVMDAAPESDTNNPQRLTNDPGNDNDPTFSADGSRIAFTSDRDGNAEIYVMDANGSTPTRLTDNTVTDSKPSFSPDEVKIAFASNGEVYVMNQDGSEQTNLTNNANANDSAPAFSPDGTKIAFKSSWGGNVWGACPGGYVCGGIGSLGDGGIYVMNADGSGQTLLSYPLDYYGLTVFDDRPDWGVRGAATTSPETSIDSGPNGPTNDNTPTFSFSGSDDVSVSTGLLYSYKVDDQEWSNYSSETSVTLGGTTGLSDGLHTFYVKAKDEARKEDQSPA